MADDLRQALEEAQLGEGSDLRAALREVVDPRNTPIEARQRARGMDDQAARIQSQAEGMLSANDRALEARGAVLGEQGYLDRYVAQPVSSVAQGVSIGASDEAFAVLNFPGQLISDLVNGRDFDPGRALQEGQQQELRRVRRNREQAPVGAFVGEMGGALFTGGASLARQGALKVGALTGGGYGFNASEGDLADRAKSGAFGAALGAALGKLGDYTAKQAGRAIGIPAARAAQRGAERVRLASPAEERLARSERFEVPYTRGQVMDDINQIAFEDEAAKGVRGKGAEAAMRPLIQEQKAAVVDAGNRLGGNRYQSQNEAGAAFEQGVKGAARALDQDVDAAYAAAKQYSSDLNAKAVPDLVETMGESLDAGIYGLLKEGAEDARQLFPGTSSALRLADGLNKEIAKIEASTGGKVTQVNFGRFESFRKSLNKLINASKKGSEDYRQLLTIKSAYDGWLDGAVERAMFTGDEGFLEAMKQARALNAYKMRLFNGDAKSNPGGAILGKIIETDANEVQALNYIFGYAKSFGGKDVQKAIRTARQALGEDNPSYQALKEAAVFRVMKAGIDQGKDNRLKVQTLLGTLDDALNGNGAPVFRELFDARELRDMREFMQMLRDIDPPRGSINYSNSDISRQRRAAAGVARVISRSINVPFDTVIRMLPGRFPLGDTMRARSAVNPKNVRSKAQGEAAGPGATAGGVAGGETGNALLERPDRRQ